MDKSKLKKSAKLGCGTMLLLFVLLNIVVGLIASIATKDGSIFVVLLLVCVFAGMTYYYYKKSDKEDVEKERKNEADRKTQAKFAAERGAQFEQMQINQSKEELITRLGTIDQFARVLAIERDESRRVLSIQAAQTELTALASKVATGQIRPEAFNDPTVKHQATETSNDLSRAGLAYDRLNRDLRRIFKL